MEQLYADRLGDYVERLAQHAYWGDLQGKAVTYFEQAAAKAISRSAWADAVRMLDQARQLQEAVDPHDVARRCDQLLLLAEALAPAGEPQRLFEEVAEEAFPLAEGLGDDARAARICQLALDALMSWGAGNAFGTPAFGRWVERLDTYAISGSRARLDADVYLAWLHLRADRWAEGRRLERRALATARELGDPESLFRVAAKTMIPLWSPSGWRDLVNLAEELADHPREGVGHRVLAEFIFYGADLLLVAGDRERWRALWREREDLGDQWQDAELKLSGPLAAAHLAFFVGNLEGTVAAAQRIVALAAEKGSPALGQAASWVLSFWPLLWLGRADRLLANHDDPSRSPEQKVTDLGWTAGLWLAHQGRIDEAERWLQSSLGRLEISDEAAARPLAWLLETAVLVRDGEAAALLAPVLHDVPGVTIPVSAVTRHLGGAARLLGDRVSAHEHYEQALAWATDIRFRPEIALTRRDLAELLLDGDDEERVEGLRHLDFAIAEFREMKMQPALERALSQKGQLKA